MMGPNDERNAVWDALRANGKRVDIVEETMRDTIKSAVQDAMPTALLTDEQHKWVQLAIEREGQSIAFRRAVIEKTLLGLVWATIAGAGYILKGWLEARGLKL